MGQGRGHIGTLVLIGNNHGDHQEFARKVFSLIRDQKWYSRSLRSHGEPLFFWSLNSGTFSLLGQLPHTETP